MFDSLNRADHTSPRPIGEDELLLDTGGFLAGKMMDRAPTGSYALRRNSWLTKVLTMLQRSGWGMGLAVLVACSMSLGEVVAQNKGNQSRKQDEKRENEAVRKAQGEVQDAEKAIRKAETSLVDARRNLTKAIAERTAAGKNVQNTIDRLESEHAEGKGLIAARERFKSAQAAYEAAAEPIRERLKNDPAYVAAQTNVDKTKAALKVEEGDARLQAAKESAAALRKVRELEKAALERDPQAKKLNKEMDEAQAALQGTIERFNKAVENDPELKSAKKAFESAKKGEDQAESAIARETRDLGTARSKLAKAQQTLAQKKAADARDSNQPKKK